MSDRLTARSGQGFAADRELRHQSAAIAGWLAALLQAPPTEEMLATLSSPAGDELLLGLERMLACSEAIATLRSIVQAGKPASTAHRLGRSYITLFEGVSGPRTIPLYESAHVGGRRLCQQPFADMQTSLQRLDMAIRTDVREPPDHIAIELAALATALDSGNGEETAALCTRLAHWTPQLCDQLRLADDSGFYAAMMQVLVAFLSVLPTALAPSAAQQRGEPLQETC